MNDWVIGAVHVAAAVGFFFGGWAFSAGTIAWECRHVGVFYAGNGVFECRERP